MKKRYSHRDIGSALGKHRSSVIREIKQNSVNGVYDRKKTHHKAYVKRKYSKYQGMKVRDGSEIEAYIEENIKPDCVLFNLIIAS